MQQVLLPILERATASASELVRRIRAGDFSSADEVLAEIQLLQEQLIQGIQQQMPGQMGSPFGMPPGGGGPGN